MAGRRIRTGWNLVKGCSLRGAAGCYIISHWIYRIRYRACSARVDAGFAFDEGRLEATEQLSLWLKKAESMAMEIGIGIVRAVEPVYRDHDIIRHQCV